MDGSNGHMEDSALGDDQLATAQRDINAAQVVNVADLQRDVTSLRQQQLEYKSRTDETFRTLLTMDLFEAYHKNDTEKIDRVEKLLEQVLAQNGRRTMGP